MLGATVLLFANPGAGSPLMPMVVGLLDGLVAWGRWNDLKQNLEGNMFVTIAIIAAVLLLGLLAFAATRPNTFEVRRAQSIQSPADRIFPLIGDFHNWASWPPYEKLDPAMTKTFSGASSGKGVIMALRAWASLARLDKLKLIPRGECFSLPAGRQPGLGPRATKGDEARPAMFFNRAVYNWAGNSKAGEGRMEIVEAAAPSRVRIKLDFLKPFEGHNTAEFTLEADGPATNVTWAMYGPMPFMMKVMSIFFSMDKMLGKEFAAGLANLKVIAENKQFSTKGA
jgi:hypothetical protein